jgi:cytochrome c
MVRIYKNKIKMIFRFDFNKGIRNVIIFLMPLFLINTNVSAIEKLMAHGGPVKGLAVSKNKKYMASASFDYSVVLWGLNPIEEKMTLIGHDAAVNTVKFSPTNNNLVSGGDDNKILLWQLKYPIKKNISMEPIILGEHRGKVVDLDFSKDGKYLITASWDGSIGVWDIIKRKNIKFIKGHKGPVYSVKYSEDNSQIYSSGYDGEIRLWNAENGNFIRALVKNGWGISVFEVNEEKNFIAYGSTDGIIKVIKFNKDKVILKIGNDRTPVLSMYYLKEKNLISFGNAKGRMIILDTNSWSLVRDFNAVNGPIWDNIIFPEDTSLIVAGLDDFLTRWEIFDFPPEILDRPGPARRFNPVEEVSNGEKQFARKCSVCHTLNSDGKKRAGPTLYKVFGRKAGTLEGYKYSEALLKSKIIWNEKTINQLFHEGPDKVTPGTKMPIQRMKRYEDRKDLITFLKEATKQN